MLSESCAKAPKKGTKNSKILNFNIANLNIVHPNSDLIRLLPKQLKNRDCLNLRLVNLTKGWSIFLMSWSPLEHQIYRDFPEQLKGSKLLLSVSGGLDSMVMLKVFSSIASALHLQITAAYVHHGGDSDYRNQAGDAVFKFCQANKLSFYLLGPADQELKSEDECRQFRRTQIFDLAHQLESKCILTAHHRQDLLETRLIRLIRGTGAQGLQSMKKLDDTFFRPFLDIDRGMLKEFADQSQVPFVEDPTNRNIDYLRNWVRQTWLPLLETKAPGGVNALARSLELIASQTLSEEGGKADGFENGIFVSDLLQLSVEKQRILVASYLKYLGASNYSQNHIKEILKHLDKPQKMHSFHLLGFIWEVNAGQVSARPKTS